jgi:rare lipoprotein A (peptidoglycan hydrolase)
MSASLPSAATVRTPLIGAASALIAVAVLVATAGPGTTRAPGTIEPLASDAFTRLAPPALDPTPTNTTSRIPSSAADPAEPLVESGGAPVPSRRPRITQPRLAIGVVVKPTPRPTQPPARVSVSSASSSGWRTAEYSWYGPGFYGSGTACGQTYSKTILGVAHKTLPCGTRVTFRNPKNGRTITVKVIDRGPYVAGRMWDLSYATCTYLGNCYTSNIQYRVR